MSETKTSKDAGTPAQNGGDAAQGSWQQGSAPGAPDASGTGGQQEQAASTPQASAQYGGQPVFPYAPPYGPQFMPPFGHMHPCQPYGPYMPYGQPPVGGMIYGGFPVVPETPQPASQPAPQPAPQGVGQPVASYAPSGAASAPYGQGYPPGAPCPPYWQAAAPGVVPEQAAAGPDIPNGPGGPYAPFGSAPEPPFAAQPASGPQVSPQFGPQPGFAPYQQAPFSAQAGQPVQGVQANGGPFMAPPPGPIPYAAYAHPGYAMWSNFAFNPYQAAHAAQDAAHAFTHMAGDAAHSFAHMSGDAAHAMEDRLGQIMDVCGDFMQGKTDPGKLMNLLTATGPNFWKGAVVGALLALVLNNPAVKANITETFSGLFGGNQPSE